MTLWQFAPGNRAMTTSSDPLVMLSGGLSVPLAPLRLLWTLEARGLKLSLDGDLVVVRPGGRLRPGERDQLKRWKPHLRALVAHEPPLVT